MNETTPTIDPRHAMLLVTDCQPVGTDGRADLVAGFASATAISRLNAAESAQTAAHE
jgi:hypothetical protein